MRVDPAYQAEIVPDGLCVPLVEAEIFFALDKAELVPFSRAHDSALSAADLAVASPEIPNRSVESNFTAPQWQDPCWIFIL